MKSIRKELSRNNLILFIFASAFILCNVGIYVAALWQNNQLLQDYRQINELVIMNNERKTSFKLYCKSHDQTLLENYYEDCELLNVRLSELEDKMQYDNNCKMQYRLVCQVMQHSQKQASLYVNPVNSDSTGLIDYLDEVDLELERCINQLINHYLEYLNTKFAYQNTHLKIILFVMNLALIGACLFLMVQNYQFSDKVLKSVGKLSEAAKEITEKNFDVPDNTETNFVELDRVSASFDQMKHTIKDMIIELNEQHQMKEYLAEAKIRELQMQMNPHFLFNSLSLVVRNIQLGERDTSVQLIQSISRILRSSIEIKSLAIPLDDEIDLLQAYLYIQKLHMRGRVTFDLDVRKSFLDEEFKIPPLTLQPLVENSVKHGLKDVVKDGKVEILITEKMDYMEVVVADNGVGFEKTLEQDIGYSEDGIPKTSIGLNNVRERLKLYYRRDDVMKVERVDGVTKITLKLYKTRNS